jgi:hypothetical protein
MCGNDDSASCLQPIFKTLDLNDFVKLLQQLPPAEYGSMSGGAGKCEYCATGSGGDCQAVLTRNQKGTVPYLACYPGTPSPDGKSPPTCPGSTKLCDGSGAAHGSVIPSEKPPKPPSIAKACSGSGSIPSCASVCKGGMNPSCPGVSVSNGCMNDSGQKIFWVNNCCTGKPSGLPTCASVCKYGMEKSCPGVSVSNGCMNDSGQKIFWVNNCCTTKPSGSGT